MPTLAVTHAARWLIISLTTALMIFVMSRLLLPVRHILLPQPQVLTDADGETTIRFEADRSHIFLDTDCIHLRWQVANVRAVEINGVGVVGEGERAECRSAPRMLVTLPDGQQRIYPLERWVLAENVQLYQALVGLPFGVIIISLFSGFGKIALRRLLQWGRRATQPLKHHQAANWGIYLLLLALLCPPILFGYFHVGTDEFLFDVNYALGDGERPFAYRVLASVAARLVAAAVPNTLAAELTELPVLEQTLKTNSGWTRDNASIFIGMLVVYTGGLYLYGLSMFALFRLYVGRLGSMLLSLVSLLLLVFTFVYFTPLYDFSHAALMAFGIVLLARQKWRLFILLYLIGCFSKETIALLTVLFVVEYASRLSWRRFIALLAAQVTLFVTIRTLIITLQAHLPGVVFQDQFAFNLNRLGLLMRDADGLAASGLIALLLLLMFIHWNSKPRLLRNSIVTGIVLLINVMFVGIINEWRVYMEFFPILLGLVYLGIQAEWQRQTAQDLNSEESIPVI